MFLSTISRHDRPGITGWDAGSGIGEPAIRWSQATGPA